MHVPAISDPVSYPKLVDWISELPAKDLVQDSLYRWHGLPEGAEAILQSFLNGSGWMIKPKQVLFGQSDCYIIIDSLGKVHYDEKKRDFYYPFLFDELDRIMAQEGTVEFLEGTGAFDSVKEEDFMIDSSKA
ncbi:hypothetical protein TWF718_007581 [Orbilia javanica]|uniref:Uncharacterized protein n=1 Tax=Orbilia javanica TaxID=47235 RepID=A0AAN8RE01_9PEZI